MHLCMKHDIQAKNWAVGVKDEGTPEPWLTYNEALKSAEALMMGREVRDRVYLIRRTSNGNRVEMSYSQARALVASGGSLVWTRVEQTRMLLSEERKHDFGDGAHQPIRVDSALERCRVPGGWLLRSTEAGFVTFMPDPEHSWEATSLASLKQDVGWPPGED